jgi:hypothetical protein
MKCGLNLKDENMIDHKDENKNAHRVNTRE